MTAATPGGQRELKKMVVAGHDVVGTRGDRSFENAIVGGVILHQIEILLWDHRIERVHEGRKKRLSFVVAPSKTIGDARPAEDRS